MSQQIQFETGEKPWLNLVGVLGGVAAIIAAVALWQASLGLSIGFAAAGVGVGGYNLCRGIAHIIVARGHAFAEVKRAHAEMIRARQQPIQIVERPVYHLEEK